MIGQNLAALTVDLVSDGVVTREDWHDWKHGKEDRLRQFLDYRQTDDMPDVKSIISPHFHAELPLIGFNYTPAAGVSLHHFRGGWSPTLRLCRGIVFDHLGNLVAKPFPKFFNFGEDGGEVQAETCEVTRKEDGHLLIVFRYGDYIVVKTRGDFDSRTAEVGKQLVKQSGLADVWHSVGLHGCTACLELIHPETRVTVDYGNRQALILIGFYDVESGLDLPLREMKRAGDTLGVEIAHEVKLTQAELLEVPNQQGENIEGYVARWPNGHRVKFKYAGYIAENREQRAQRRAQKHQPEPLAGVGRERPFRGKDQAVQKTAAYMRQPVKRR